MKITRRKHLAAMGSALLGASPLPVVHAQERRNDHDAEVLYGHGQVWNRSLPGIAAMTLTFRLCLTSSMWLGILAVLWSGATEALAAVTFAHASSAWGAARDLLWEDQFDRAGGDEFTDRRGLAVEGARVFVAAASGNASGNFDFLVRAYDTHTGALLWADYFDNAGGFDQAVAVKAHQGRVYAAGSVSNAAGTFVPAIRAYDSRTGALLWQDQFDRAGRNDRARFVVAGSGRVFVTGLAASGAPDNFGDFYVRAYDARSGALLWEDHDPGIGVFGDGVGLALEGGRVFASGTVLTSGIVGPGPIIQDWLVRAYDANTGTVLWEDQFNKGSGTNTNIAFGVVAHGGRVFAAGTGGRDCLFSLAGNCDFIVRGYDAQSGMVLWEDQHDRDGTDDVSFGGLDAHGNRVFVIGFGGNDCGLSGVPTNCDFLLRAYGARTGSLLWEDQVDKAGGDETGHAVVVKGGRVFAAGDTSPAGIFSFDLLVRAYDAGGDDDDDHDD